MSKVIEWIYDQKWAIKPSALEAIIDIASRQVADGMDYTKIFHGSSAETSEMEKEAIASIPGDHLEGSHRAKLRGSSAIIPVLGPIFPRANMFTMFSGGSSISSLMMDLKLAMDSDLVENIILNIDSPGGAITGVSELADAILHYNSKKPITSYVYGNAASAGYWIGSSAGTIIMDKTAEVGSIGVVATHTNTTERDKKQGVEQIEIVSSISPQKRPKISTAEGKYQIQSIVDELGDLFVNAVAVRRETTYENVIQNFGKGGMLVGATAIEAGMADGLGSLENLIEEQNDISNQSLTGGIFMNSAELKAQFPETYSAIFDAGCQSVSGDNDGAIETAKAEGIEAGIAQENKRISDIDTMAVHGFDDIIAKGKADPEATKETVALEILGAQKTNIKKTKENVDEDGEALAGQVSGLAEDNKEELSSDKTSQEEIDKAGAEIAAGQKRN